MEDEIKSLIVHPNGANAYLALKNGKIAAVELISGNVIDTHELKLDTEELIVLKMAAIDDLLYILYCRDNVYHLKEIDLLFSGPVHFNSRKNYSVPPKTTQMVFNNDFIFLSGLSCNLFSIKNKELTLIPTEASEKVFLNPLDDLLLTAYVNGKLNVISNSYDPVLSFELETKAEINEIVSENNLVLISFKDKFIR